MTRLSRRKDQATDPRTEADKTAWLQAQGWRLWWRADGGLDIIHDQTRTRRSIYHRTATQMLDAAYASVCERPAGRP